jgi:PAS domain S-box-containing protein
MPKAKASPKESKTQFSEGQTMIDALVSSIGDGLIVVNEYGIITHINQVALDILGAKREQMINAWLPKAVPSKSKDGGDIPMSERLVVKALLTGQPLSEIVYYERADGSLVPASGTASPFLVKGKPSGAVIVFRDISRELQIEKAKDEFISLTSHQLRTPLTSISFFSEMMASGRAGTLTSRQQEYAEKIHLSTTRMIRLVGSILNVSRIELDRLKVDPHETDIVQIVKDYIEEVLPIADSKNVQLSFKGPESAVAKIDASLLGQVIHNLLTNAIRYSSDEEGGVEIELKQVDDDYQITVSDNGIGIPKNAQTRIFERFYRADNAVNMEGQGTGLGLYLAKMIMEAAGCRIWFKSKENKGTTFYLMIPKTGMTPRISAVQSNVV